VLKKLMNLRLEAIVLHDSLHRCLALQGTGTRIIEAKLAQTSLSTCRRHLMPWTKAAASRSWCYTG
jgi:hypothetical protein